MSEHLIIHKQIQQANQVVPPNGEVHWFSDYYGTSTYGVISQLGFRSDITFRYPENQGDLPRDRPTYLVRHLHNIGYKPLPETLRELFDVTYYANGFDKLTPKLRLLTPNPDLTYAKGESVRLQAEVSERSAASIKGIEFLVDGMVIATDMIPPYETLWQSDALGQFHISARSIGVVETTTRGAWLSIGTPALIRSIGMSTDDAEELTPSGYMYLDSSKLNLMTETDYGFQPQIVGLRFQDIQWSSEQTLAEAYIQFTSTRDDDSDTRLVIRAELSPHAQPLEEKNANLSSRMLTSTVVEWQPEPWEEGDSTRRQRTPNLAPLFDELFAQAQWQPGNAVLFIISGAGERAANSFERAKGSITTPRLSLLGEAGEVVEMTKAVEPRVSLQQAAESYARHCALCHGERGEGNKADYANALFNPDFLAIATDEFINHAIAEGRPGTAMSAWSEAVGGPFSDSEIGALVDYIRSHDDSSQRPLTQADIDIAEFVGDVTRGLPVYQAQCASCHGDSGGGLVAPSLNNPQFLDTVSNAYLYRSIADGRRNTTMPAYQNTLKTETINDLVAVIRSWDENDTQMLPVERSSSPVHIPHIQDVQQKLINPDGDAPNFSLRSGRFVAADDVVAAMRAGKRMLLLDARPPSDWYKARAKGALSTPFYAIEQDAQWIENDGTWVIAYCACPHASSGQVVDELRKRGFLNTAVLDEGIDYWIDRGYPTEYGYEKQP